jgi:CheY-like chemotaxis protein
MFKAINSIHILLVEDNEGDILLTREALSEGNILSTLSVVKDGWEAMQYLEKKGKYINELSPGLILLDVNLPKMNGHEVLKNIKSNENLKHIPVVMLTTSSSEIDVLQSYQNYANCYITKPLDVTDFLKVIASIEAFWITIVQLPHKINN